MGADSPPIRATPEQIHSLNRWLDRHILRAIKQDRRAARREAWRQMTEELLLRRPAVGLLNLWQVKGGRTSSGYTPEHQRRVWKFRKIEVEVEGLGLPDAILKIGWQDKPVAHATARLYQDMQTAILAEFGPRVRWVTRRELRQLREDRALGIDRSFPNAARTAALEVLRGYHEDILAELHRDGSQAAHAQMRRILEANGLKIINDRVWGGVALVPLDHSGPELHDEFPAWLVTETIAKLRRVYEHQLKRKLTDEEVDRVVRTDVEGRLRRKQNAIYVQHGINLSGLESARRADRRQREEPHVRIAPSARDRLLAAIVANRSFGRNELARLLGRRPQAVSRDLLALETAGSIKIEKVGQNQVFIPDPKLVPPYRVERVGGSIVRVAEESSDEDPSELIDNNSTPRRRARRGDE